MSVTRQSGVTLIELMVVVSILAIVAAIGMPSFNGWMANQRIRTKAEGVQAGLHVARAEALKLNQKITFVLGKDASGDPDSSWKICLSSKFDAANMVCPDADVIQARAATEGGENVSVNVQPEDSQSVNFTSIGLTDPGRIESMDFYLKEKNEKWRLSVGIGGQLRLYRCDPAASTGETSCP